MSRLKQCLKEEKGSSLMIAIIILLVCTVLGGIVISAAAVNMSRIERGRREQQAYLTAESTALMLRDLLENQSLTIKTGEDGQPQVSSSNTDSLGSMLKEDVERILGIGVPAEDTTARELEISGEDALAGQQVKVSYGMNSGYGIELKIQVEESGKVLSQMLAELPASLKTQDGETVLNWKRGAITRLEDGEAKEGEKP